MKTKLRQAIADVVNSGYGDDLLQFVKEEMVRYRQQCEARYMVVGEFLASKIGLFARLSSKNRFAISRVIAENMDEIKRLISEAEQKEGPKSDG